MDSEHRHELKSNELADFLTNLPQFCKDNARPILGVSLIIIALVTWPMFNKMGKQKTIARQSQVTENIQQLNQSIGKALSKADDPQALDTILLNAQTLLDSSSTAKNADLKALACIKAAQGYRTWLHLAKNNLDAAAVEEKILKAADAYTKAGDVAKTPTLQAMAQLGLGLCAEERGQTEEAAAIYKAIVANESFAATALPKEAQARLDALTDNAKAFIFAPTAMEEMSAEELKAAIEAKKLEIEQTQKKTDEAPSN